MSNFIARDYENIVADIVHDTFYIECSNRGKISTIRQYSEVFVRQILGAEPEDKFMLGNSKNELKERSQFVSHAVCVIQSYGNDATHTQHLQRFEDADLETVVDALFDLIAYLFIVFFKKYPINYDTDPTLLKDFSLLPPIIRYKTLNQLFQSEPENIYIIDRLALSILKTYGQEDAFDWLESHRTSFEALPYPDEEQINIRIDQIGPEEAQARLMFCVFKMYTNYVRTRYEMLAMSSIREGLYTRNLSRQKNTMKNIIPRALLTKLKSCIPSLILSISGGKFRIDMTDPVQFTQ